MSAALAHRFWLRHDPVTPLLAAGHPALTWNVRRDLCGERLNARSLWDLARVRHGVETQNADGSWTYQGGNPTIRSRRDYGLLATYSQLLVLVSEYRVDRRLPMVQRAAENLFGFQTAAGDIRGIYGTQYSPNYTADILRLLIEGGYQSDPRVLCGLGWLLSMRQDDGGWAVPARTSTRGALLMTMRLPGPIEPNRARPSSHLITGIVLRAFAAHPTQRHLPEVHAAALLLAARLFRRDAYLDRQDPSYWTKLAFPFRWTDVVSSLDALAMVGVPNDHPEVARALRWIRDRQLASGLWSCGYPNHPDLLADHWVTFATARAVVRYFGREALEARREEVPAHARSGESLESAHAER